jgi:hypothetical protein
MKNDTILMMARPCCLATVGVVVATLACTPAPCPTPGESGIPATIQQYAELDLTLFGGTAVDITVEAEGGGPLPEDLRLEDDRLRGAPLVSGTTTLFFSGTSVGDGTCTATPFRDLEATFLVEPVACDATTFASRCDGAVAERCDFGQVVREDCDTLELAQLSADAPPVSLGETRCELVLEQATCVSTSSSCGTPYRDLILVDDDTTFRGSTPCDEGEACVVSWSDDLGTYEGACDLDVIGVGAACAALGPEGSDGRPVCLDGRYLLTLPVAGDTTDPCAAGLLPRVVDCAGHGAECVESVTGLPSCQVPAGAVCPVNADELVCPDGGGCGLGRTCPGS